MLASGPSSLLWVRCEAAGAPPPPQGAGAPAALAAQLFGRENRWGKLPVTIYPSSYNTEQDMANYDMAKPPGRTYRYYTGKPLWDFGTGLSLTTFAMHCSGPGGTGLGVYLCTITRTQSPSLRHHQISFSLLGVSSLTSRSRHS